MKILILDDEQYRHDIYRKNLIGHSLTHVETARDCIRELNTNGPWDWCFLDHDLGGTTFAKSGPGTGYEVAEFLRDNNSLVPKNVIVHSLNPAGALNMISVIPGARHIPFAWNKVQV